VPATTADPSATGAPTAKAAPKRLGDRIFAGLALSAGLVIVAALAGVFIFLAIEGWDGMSQDAQYYDAPRANDFLSYVWPLVFGTVLAATIALIIAVPLSIGIALMVSHYAPRSLATPIAYVIDLLAAVPSVVFGLWGILTLAPRMVPIYEWLNAHFSWIPLFAGNPDGGVNPVGKTILTAGIVLAIMILPIITAITREIFAQTPRLHEEAALALGATRWEMIRYAVFPYARSGMVSAVMLGLGRALGETMAVAMVISAGKSLVTFNLLANANPTSIAANIASNYKEGTPARIHVLIATGLVLFLLTFLVNFAARWIVARAERNLTR
jgi:phosphate transport system permease protein